MRLDTVTSIVERTNIGESTKFSVANSAHMANMLSDLLYSDKVSAVIRELSCNAMDSHVEAGKPELPITVHLPDAFDKSFWVRDYGVSMDDDTVRKVFAVLGESTKTKTDKVTGGFGIGAKSPFALVEAFTVETFLDGKHKIYSAFKNEIDEREITLLFEHETSEENGVKVSVPVQKDLVYEFYQKSAFIFSYFTVYPKIIGNNNFEKLENSKIIISGTKWRLTNSRNQSVVIMGNVAYPFYLNDIDKTRGLVQAFRGLEFIMDVGECSPTPSREALQYNEKTINALKTVYNTMLEEINETIGIELDKQPNLWDASSYFYTTYEYLHEKLIDVSNIKYKNQPILKRYERIKLNFKGRFNSYLMSIYELSRKVCYGNSFEQAVGALILKHGNVLFYKNNEGQAGLEKIYNDVLSKNNKAQIVIFENDSPHFEYNFNIIHQNYGYFDFTDTYDIGIKNNKIIDDVNNFNETFYEYISDSSYGSKGYKEVKLPRNTDNIYYMLIPDEKFYLINYDSTKIPYLRNGLNTTLNFSVFYTTMKNSHKLDKKLYFIHESDKKVLKGKTTWIDFMDVIEKHVDNSLNEIEKDLGFSFSDFLNTNGNLENFVSDLGKHFTTLKYLYENTTNNKFKKKYEAIRKVVENRSKYILTIGFTGIYTEKHYFLLKILFPHKEFRQEDTTKFSKIKNTIDAIIVDYPVFKLMLSLKMADSKTHKDIFLDILNKTA